MSLSNLSQELTELVFTKLSMKDVFRLRSVCKVWKDTLGSSQFQRLYQQLHSAKDSWLFIYNNDNKVLGWQSSDHRWCKFFLPNVYLREWVTAGGNICLKCFDPQVPLRGRLFVGNLFTGAWKSLRSPPATYNWRTWVMLNNEVNEDYNIIFLCHISGQMRIYNSVDDGFLQRELPQSIVGSQGSIDFVLLSTATPFGRIVHCIHGDSRSVYTYDVMLDIWKQYEVKLPSDLVFHCMNQGYWLDMPPKLIKGPKGQVLLIGGSTIVSCHGVQCIAVIWELQQYKMEWTEMARAPFDMCSFMLEHAKENREPPLLHVGYVGHGNLILTIVSGSLRAMVYNVEQETWTWLDLPANFNWKLSMCLMAAAE